MLLSKYLLYIYLLLIQKPFTIKTIKLKKSLSDKYLKLLMYMYILYNAHHILKLVCL